MTKTAPQDLICKAVMDLKLEVEYDQTHVLGDTLGDILDTDSEAMIVLCFDVQDGEVFNGNNPYSAGIVEQIPTLALVVISDTAQKVVEKVLTRQQACDLFGYEHVEKWEEDQTNQLN